MQHVPSPFPSLTVCPRQKEAACSKQRQSLFSSVPKATARIAADRAAPRVVPLLWGRLDQICGGGFLAVLLQASKTKNPDDSCGDLDAVQLR